MGNDCWNNLTITCEANPDVLNSMIDNEFKYKKNDEYTEDRFNECVHIVKLSKRGFLHVKMYSKNQPDFKWLDSLLDKYPNCWVKNEWNEEGGLAGVWVGSVIDNKKIIKEMDWRDLSIEEQHYFFRED